MDLLISKVMTFLRDQIVFSPRLAVSSFAKGFKRALMRNGCHVKISAEQMSKHLSRALHEYTMFEMTANDPRSCTPPPIETAQWSVPLVEALKII